MDAAYSPPVEELVREATRGSAEAESQLCRRFLPALMAFAARRLSDPELRRELVQDSMLTLLEAIRADRIQEPERASAFLLGICRNLARERLRTDARRQRLMEQSGAVLAAAEEPPVLPLARPELLEDCLSQLSQRARAIIRRSYADEDTTAEIALALEMRETNVRVARHRALKALRECIERPTSYERASGA
jgi:RNA polymerase sigma factor (sigma-70 family)